jgi:hypothetical protein
MPLGYFRSSTRDFIVSCFYVTHTKNYVGITRHREALLISVCRESSKNAVVCFSNEVKDFNQSRILRYFILLACLKCIAHLNAGIHIVIYFF